MQQYFYELIGRRKGAKRRKHFHHLHRSNGLVLLRQWGFELSVRPSLLGEEAGLGVFVSRGSVPAGATAALYPGTVYEPGQPVLLQSVANQYILRCSDGIMVDGNNRGVSRMVFSSLHGRERAGNTPLCDPSWIEKDEDGFYRFGRPRTPFKHRCFPEQISCFLSRPANPLSVGQIVNNATDDRTSNVAYGELDVPNDGGEDLGPDFRCHLPNVPYEACPPHLRRGRAVRIVPLVATRDITDGEELYSSYLSLVPS